MAFHTPHRTDYRPAGQHLSAGSLSFNRSRGELTESSGESAHSDVSPGDVAAVSEPANSDADFDVVSHRIDSEHSMRTLRTSRQRKTNFSGDSVPSEATLHSPRSSEKEEARIDQSSKPDLDASSLGRQRQEWLQLHAVDLITRIQEWSESVDSREAHLNARSAQQDLRERVFRLRKNDLAFELSEQRRSIEQLKQELATLARRLSFADPSLAAQIASH